MATNNQEVNEEQPIKSYKAIGYGMLALAASVMPLTIGMADIGGEMSQTDIKAWFYDCAELIGFVSAVGLGMHLKKTKSLTINDLKNMTAFKDILGAGQIATFLGAGAIALNGGNYMPEDGVFPALYLLTHIFVLFTMSELAIKNAFKNEYLTASMS